MRRREFLGVIGAGVAGAAAAPRVGTRSDHLWRVGLELYTVRNAMKQDPERTLAAVRAMGYDDVELLWTFDNFGRTPQQVKDSLKKAGLKAPSAHIAPELLAKDWVKSLETARFLGHDMLVVPSLPDETRDSLEAWRRWADRFNDAGNLARHAGIWLAFHNEPEHMKPIHGVVPYDVFIERTDPASVRLQLDVGNMELGGGKPLTYLREYRDRYWSFHIKDVVEDGSRDTELGTGRVNIRAILAAIPDVHKKTCHVEQESPRDELASARRDYEYLKRVEF